MAITYVGGISPRFPRRPALPSSQALPAPTLLTLPLCGAIPEVSVGEKVLVGQLLAASPDARIPLLHAPVSGTVEAVTDTQIHIQNDFDMELHEACLPSRLDLKTASDEELLETVEATGLVAPEDACLSLAQKIRDERGKVHTLLFSAVDDEPFGGIASHLLLTEPNKLLGGMKLMLRLYGCRQGILVIGEDSIKALNQAAQLLAGQSWITLRKIKPIYPISHPRQLVLALACKEQKRGMSLADTGYAVFPTDSLLALYDAFASGVPLTSRRLFLDGDCLPAPIAVTLPIGTPLSHLISALTLKKKPICLARGRGALSARAVETTEPIGKNDTGILLFSARYRRNDAIKRLLGTPEDANACIHCGICLPHCPAELDIPAILARKRNPKTAEPLGVAFCIGCGCCSYVCPAMIPIASLMGQIKREIEEEAAPSEPTLSENAPEENASAEKSVSAELAEEASAPWETAEAEMLSGDSSEEVESEKEPEASISPQPQNGSEGECP